MNCYSFFGYLCSLSLFGLSIFFGLVAHDSEWCKEPTIIGFKTWGPSCTCDACEVTTMCSLDMDIGTKCCSDSNTDACSTGFFMRNCVISDVPEFDSIYINIYYTITINGWLAQNTPELTDTSACTDNGCTYDIYKNWKSDKYIIEVTEWLTNPNYRQTIPDHCLKYHGGSEIGFVICCFITITASMICCTITSFKANDWKRDREERKWKQRRDKERRQQENERKSELELHQTKTPIIEKINDIKQKIKNCNNNGYTPVSTEEPPDYDV
jgi:hypothetical protein